MTETHAYEVLFAQRESLFRLQKYLASLVFPCLGFRAPAFAMSFRGSTNSRGKIGTARSLSQKLLTVALKFLHCFWILNCLDPSIYFYLLLHVVYLGLP